MFNSIILFVEIINHDSKALYEVFTLEAELLRLFAKIIHYFQKRFLGY